MFADVPGMFLIGAIGSISKPMKYIRFEVVQSISVKCNTAKHRPFDIDSYVTKYRCLPMFANVLGMFLMNNIGFISKLINHLLWILSSQFQQNVTLIRIGPLTLIVALQSINIHQCLPMCIKVFDRSYMCYHQTNTLS